MHCALCGYNIDPHSERYVSTTSGETVHLTCAERDAQAGWRWRHCWALLHAFSASGITIAVWLSNVPAWIVLALALILASSMLVHQRWLYFLKKDLRRWLFDKRH